MFAQTLAFLILFTGAAARAADHGELQRASRVNFPACERKLWNSRWINNQLTGEPRNPNDPHGFVTDQLPLTLETAVQAYSVGVYIAGESEQEPGNALLYTPAQRGVMMLDPDDPDANIPKRDLRKMRAMRATGYQVKVDKDFEEIVNGCRLQTRRRDPDRERRKPHSPDNTKSSDTWITDGIADVYNQMHMRPQRLAHCVGTYYENKLVGGLFVVVVRGVITGKSMYHLPGVGSDAGKLALYELRNRARIKGHKFIDTEDSLGLLMDWGDPREDRRKIPREEFRELLMEQQSLDRPF